MGSGIRYLSFQLKVRKNLTFLQNRNNKLVGPGASLIVVDPIDPKLRAHFLSSSKRVWADLLVIVRRLFPFFSALLQGRFLGQPLIAK